VNENFCALVISILKNCTPEQAFKCLDTGSTYVTKGEALLDAPEMIEQKKQGFTYNQIGEMFGVSGHVVFRRIKRYKESIN
jgi:hypothetical protein